MRINKFVALATGISRRAADAAIAEGRVLINGKPAKLGQDVEKTDKVHLLSASDMQASAMQGAAEQRTEPYMKYGEGAAEVATPQRAASDSSAAGSAGRQAGTVHIRGLDGSAITPDVKTLTIILNKPVSYVCSRAGQGSKTIYDLLPPELHSLKPVGRLDKDSSGLLLMTNDGQLAHQLTHPSQQKSKVYEIEIDKPLAASDLKAITGPGVDIGDTRPSSFQLKPATGSKQLTATLTEGRNRQIRRTFAGLGYTVTRLHRTQFGPYHLGDLKTGAYRHLLS